MRIIKLTYTLDGSGTLTVSTDRVKGQLIAIHFEEDPEAQASTIDFVFTSVTTSQAILTFTNQGARVTSYPRVETTDNVDANNTYNATEPVYTPFVLFDEAIQMVVTGGTAAGRGTIYFAID